MEAEYAVIRPRVQEIPRWHVIFFGRRKPGGCCGVGLEKGMGGKVRQKIGHRMRSGVTLEQ